MISVRLLLSAIAIIFFTACESGNEVSTFLASADSVEVRFANTANDQLSHNTADSKAVQKLVQLVSKGAQAGALDCPTQPAGIVLFFEKGQMKQAVMFTDIKSNCRYFITKVNDKTYHAAIDDEAVNFLNGIGSASP